MKDVFSLQEQTALKIAQSLNLKLSPQEQQAIQHRYTQNPQAYDAYLRGEALVQFSDQPEKVEAARRHFEDALHSDPDYAPALAGLAFVEGQTYRNIDANPSHLQRAEQFAQRAMAIDPRLAELAWHWERSMPINMTMRQPRKRVPHGHRFRPEKCLCLGSAFLGPGLRTTARSRGRGESGTGIHASGAIPLPQKLLSPWPRPDSPATLSGGNSRLRARAGTRPGGLLSSASVWDRPI